jgi:hypothetical protein
VQFEVDRTLEEGKACAGKPHKRTKLAGQSPFSWLLSSAAVAPNGNGFLPVKVKLLCGADLLESFHIPGLWSDDDVSYFFSHSSRRLRNFAS